MHIISCFNPQYIYNRYTKVNQYVACGKCEACLSSRSRTWVQRLEQESRCHKYAVFFTLTYSDNYVPTMVRFGGENSLLVDCSTGMCIGFEDVQTPLPETIYYLDKLQIQKFIKRLRKYITTNNKQHHVITKETLRYYVVGEYGPTTYRPHYHGILWFDSEFTAAEIGNMLHKAWSAKQKDGSRDLYGYINWSFVENTAAAYVAKYVNCFTHLPKVLQHKSIRPFALCSKCPPIGTLFANSEIIKQYFYSHSTTVTIFDNQLCQYVDVPMWRTFKDRIYPKISGFAQLGTHARVLLYSLSKFYACEDWEDFKNQLPYICDTCAVFKEWLTKNEGLTNDGDGSYYVNDYGLRITNRLFRISRRVVVQSEIFGIKVRDYVHHIEQFYYKTDMLQLKKYFEFQEKFCKEYPDDIHYLLALDPENFYRLLLDTDVNKNNVLKSFHVPPQILSASHETKTSFYYQITSVGHRDTLHYISQITDMYRKSTKTRKKNDYLLAHPESIQKVF